MICEVFGDHGSAILSIALSWVSQGISRTED